MTYRTAIAASLATLALSACVVAPVQPAYGYGYGAPAAAAAVTVDVAPPPVRAEVVPPLPFAGAIWINGYWGWSGHQHVWVPGRYEHPRPGYVWVPHRWENVHGHWQLHEGGWQHHG